MFTLILAALAIGLLYYVCIKPLSKWKSRGSIQGNPLWLFGDFLNVVLQRQSFPEYIIWQYERFKGHRYAGTYMMMQPILMIRDVNLLKQITIKDFEHFTDHSPFIHEEVDQLWSRNLFALTGQKWKDMRPILSPAFTSSKMKTISVLMSECAEEFCNYLVNKNEDLIKIEAKDLFSRFTNDVIGTTAFGIKVDSLKEPNNHFYLMGKEATDLSGWKNFRLLINLIYPPMMQVKMLSAKMFEDNVSKYFSEIIEQTLKTREEKGITRGDMLQLLLEARKGIDQDENEDSTYNKTKATDGAKLTIVDIVAQAMVFFFAGFDTVSTLITFMSYELALNDDIQEALREEINETLQQCDGKLNHDLLAKMKYMDMVVSESLRKWPSMSQMDRRCTKPYTIEPLLPGEKPVRLELNDIVSLPFFGIHRDPELYPDPEKFDPERFSEERKAEIRPGSYLPFGIGPRNCIGSRFALLEAKVLFFHLLRRFRIVPIERTRIPVKISAQSFTLAADGGMHLGLKRIKK